MPKRMSVFDPPLDYSIGDPADAPSYKRPALALKAMSVISTFALAEAHAGVLFSTLMESERVAGARAFAEYGNNHQRVDAILAIAKVKLTPEEYEIVKVLTDEYLRVSNARNAIAHGVWGVSSKLPNAVLLGDESVLTITFAGLYASKQDENFKMNDMIMIYEDSDFDQMTAEIRAISTLLSTYCSYRMSINAKNEGCVPKENEQIAHQYSQRQYMAVRLHPFVADKLTEKLRQRAKQQRTRKNKPK